MKRHVPFINKASLPESILRACPHRGWTEGQRSFGGNLPPNCQGAYFPGDEPGHVCGLAGSGCEAGITTWGECPRFKQTGLPCPTCNSASTPLWEPILKDSLTGEFFIPCCCGEDGMSFSAVTEQFVSVWKDSQSYQRQLGRARQVPAVILNTLPMEVRHVA